MPQGLFHSLPSVAVLLWHPCVLAMVCATRKLNTFSPTHEPPSPSLHYICSSDTIWHRHKSSTNVGYVDSAALGNWLSILARPGLHRRKEAEMFSSRAPENTCPVAKTQPWGWFTLSALGNCQGSLQEGQKRRQDLAHWQRDFRPNDSPLEESDSFSEDMT